MPVANVRDTKLIQYLNEAYGKEKELETALQAHIAMTERAPYKKRLRAHLTETKNHWRQIQRRVKKLGGSVGTPEQAAQTVVSKAASAVKGPVHALRGTGENEKMLKNAKTEYSEEFQEIATYTAIETLAETVGDKETARLAKGIRREEERMAKFLEKLIPTLTKAVMQEEIPAAERRANGRRRAGASRSRAASSGARAGTSRSRAASPSRSSSSRSSSSRSAGGSRSASSSRSGSRSSRSRAR